jgi:glutaredoxin
LKLFNYLPKAVIYISLFYGITLPTTAEIYKWVDESGNVHFTDSPPKDKITEEVTLQINSYSSTEVTTIDGVIVPGNRVVMYSTSRCGYCKKARRHFRKKRIAFHEYDIEKSGKGKRDFKSLKGSGVPIILFGDKRINGFSDVKFDRAYAKYKLQKDKDKKEIDKKKFGNKSKV